MLVQHAAGTIEMSCKCGGLILIASCQLQAALLRNELQLVPNATLPSFLQAGSHNSMLCPALAVKF